MCSILLAGTHSTRSDNVRDVYIPEPASGSLFDITQTLLRQLPPGKAVEALADQVVAMAELDDEVGPEEYERIADEADRLSEWAVGVDREVLATS
jgi:hypothetical protein